MVLLDDILPYYRTSVESEKINDYDAYCHYALGSYLMGAMKFKSVYETYSQGEYAELSLFYYAYCLYLESPPVELDQTYTQNALDGLTLFIGKFPRAKNTNM